MLAEPTKRKRGGRMPIRAAALEPSPISSIHVSPTTVHVVTVSGRKRSHTNVADSRDGKTDTLSKRKNLGQVSGFINPAPGLPRNGRPRTPSFTRGPGAVVIERQAQDFGDATRARQKINSIETTSAQQPNLATLAILEKAIPNLFSRADLPRTTQQAVQRK